MVYKLKNYAFNTSWKKNLFVHVSCEYFQENLWFTLLFLSGFQQIFMDPSFVLENKAQATNSSHAKFLARPEVEFSGIPKGELFP